MRRIYLLTFLVGTLGVFGPSFSQDAGAGQDAAGGMGGFAGMPGSGAAGMGATRVPGSSAASQGGRMSGPNTMAPNITAPVITNQPELQAQGKQNAARDSAKGDADVKSPAPDNQYGKNEFQEFVSFSTGRNLPLFGYELFGKAPSTFAPVDHIPVTADYVIGPGDEVVIRAWGQVDIDYKATVDRNGNLAIPKVGNVNLAGIRYQDLQGYLKTAIGRVFRNFDLNVSLGQLRSIPVFVVGYAQRPGNYTVSSLSTLVNTLFASGGPSSRGSMRRIQLKREGQVVTEFDMYDLLIKGDKSKDVRLLPGDVIYIPAIGPLVAVSGSVNTPAIYELKGPQTMESTIALAGGVTTTASVEKVLVERIENRKARKVDEFSFDAAGLARPVEDGDLLTVLAISPRFGNAVTLRGNVAEPARYPWKAGMRIKDLIPEKETLITKNYWHSKNAAVRVEVDSQDKLGLEVKRSIEEVNWDYAVIERLNRESLTTQLVPFNLGKAIIDNDPAANLELMPGDVITIFSKNDIQVPQARQTRYVRLEGEINQSGVYQVQPGETLQQLLMRVGGVTPQAYLFGAEFTRESARVLQQKRMDEAITQLERDAERSATNRTQAALNPEDAAQLKQEIEGRRMVIRKLRQLKATGRIPLGLDDEVNLNNLPDLALEDGDRLVIPSRPSVVSVIGSVYNQNTFLYRQGNTVRDYLNQAGGETKDADQQSVYVVKADGTVMSKRQSGWLRGFDSYRVMPGDAIIVPEQLEKNSWLKGLRDWTQVFYQFGLGAAAIAVFR